MYIKLWPMVVISLDTGAGDKTASTAVDSSGAQHGVAFGGP